MDILGPVISSIEVDPYTTKEPIVTSVLSHWQEAAAGRWAPPWRDIDIMMLPPPLLPYILVADAMPDGDIVYRYWGRGHSSYHNTDYSGKSLQTMTPTWVREFLAHQYTRVIETRAPKLFETTYGNIENPVYSLRLPLSDDGERITGILSIAERDGVARKLRDWIRVQKPKKSQDSG